jgi:DNA-3-methyladenine glycosylase
MTRLPAEFYARPTLDVLRDLMGKVLVHEARGVRTAGVIVEAEAYIGESDPACHAAPGPTARNAPLYGPPGRAYVYLNYGLHSLVNAVTEEEGSPAAILIRALEPVEGMPAMRRRRLAGRRRDRERLVRGANRRRRGGGVRVRDLCRGPGNLTVALGIGLRHNRSDLTRGPLAIEDHGMRSGPLAWSPRIGIRVGADRPWRCFVAASDCVSGGRAGISGGFASSRRAP